MTPAAETEIRSFLLGEVRLDDVATERDEWPEVDTFGNPGTVTLERFVASGLSSEERGTLSGAYLAAGYSELPRDSHRDDDQVRFRLSRLEPSNPFLWENDVEVGLGGRTLLGAQRCLLERKAASLREELASPSLPARRRRVAERMIAELEAGLLPRVSAILSRRVFQPAPVLTPNHSIGKVVPLRRLSQILYTVLPLDPADRDEEDTEPMFLTFLGFGEAQSTFLFSGGIHGQRTTTDLEDGLGHHAWFQNRRVDTVEDTAPWIARRIYRELTERGESELVVRWDRDEEPVLIRKTGERTQRVLVAGAPRDLPVILAETEKDDRLSILADAESPLVLRLEEAEAELLRTIDEFRTLGE